MTLIWLSHFIPFPPRGGAPQRSYHLLREASRHRDTMLIAFNRPAVDAETLKAYSAELRKFCAEVEIWELPFAWRGARWWAGLIQNTMQSLPYACEAYRSPDLLKRWTERLRSNPDALIHIDSSDLAAYVPAAAGHRVLMNHHNCESAMADRRARVEANPVKRFFLAQQARRQAALERHVCPKVAVNAVVSVEDGESLRVQAPSAHVHVVANGTDTRYFVPDPSAEQTNTLVFAGSLSWYPNVSGLRFFRKRIWPRVKSESPGVHCILAGKTPVREIVDWAATDASIDLISSPLDIRPWIARGSVFVCPIVDGGGTRLKLLDAMSSGKAIVSTRVGAEGLGLKNGEHALIVESEEDFVDATLSLLRDASLRSSLARNARDFVQRRFSWDTIGADLEAAYSCAGCADPPH
jgi:glycosyltransferase involved in cell wall biosynthesis